MVRPDASALTAAWLEYGAAGEQGSLRGEASKDEIGREAESRVEVEFFFVHVLELAGADVPPAEGIGCDLAVEGGGGVADARGRLGRDVGEDAGCEDEELAARAVSDEDVAGGRIDREAPGAFDLAFAEGGVDDLVVVRAVLVNRVPAGDVQVFVARVDRQVVEEPAHAEGLRGSGSVGLILDRRAPRSGHEDMGPGGVHGHRFDGPAAADPQGPADVVVVRLVGEPCDDRCRTPADATALLVCRYPEEALPVDRDGAGPPECIPAPRNAVVADLPLEGSGGAEPEHEALRRAEPGRAVGDVDVAVVGSAGVVDRDADRNFELPCRSARDARLAGTRGRADLERVGAVGDPVSPGLEKFTRGGELEDPVVAPVGDVKVAVRLVHRDRRSVAVAAHPYLAVSCAVAGADRVRVDVPERDCGGRAGKARERQDGDEQNEGESSGATPPPRGCPRSGTGQRVTTRVAFDGDVSPLFRSGPPPRPCSHCKGEHCLTDPVSGSALFTLPIGKAVASSTTVERWCLEDVVRTALDRLAISRDLMRANRSAGNTAVAGADALS